MARGTTRGVEVALHGIAVDFEACNDAAEGCAATCVRTHRPGG